MSGTKDEKVNGAKIAAEILERMRPENKARILKEIQASDPTIATKIESNLFNFTQISELTPQAVQVLINEIDAKDLVLALKTAAESIRTVFFNNMSERRRSIVLSDIEALPPTRLSEIEAAQRRIVTTLDDLRRKGLIRTQSQHDVWV